MHAEEGVLQYQQHQLSQAQSCSVSHTYIEVQIILYIKILRMRERNNVIFILHLGLKFQENIQCKVYFILGKKTPQQQPTFSPKTWGGVMAP